MLTGVPQAGPTRPVVVFDFDGTVALGDGPVLAYAEAAFSHLAPTAVPVARETVARVLAGEDHRWPDPYGAVAALCAEVDPAAVQAAYLASREALARTGLDVTLPAGLTEALDRWEGLAVRALVTNSPARGTVEVLARLGLADRFDRVVVEARKPSGLRPILQTLLDEQAPDRLVSIGDHWPNDIQPALDLGCLGFHICGEEQDPAPAHARAASVTELLPVVDTWLQSLGSGAP